MDPSKEYLDPRREQFLPRAIELDVMDIDDHAEELASALGVDKTEVTSDLEDLLAYSVPIDEAKQSIRRKHGEETGSATPQSLSIEEITPDHGAVTVTATVLTVGTRTIRYQGEDATIREGTLADESGTISYTAWQDFGFEPGDTVTIGNASVREWDGDPELNLGANTSVALADQTPSIPYEIGGDSTLLELEPGDRGRNVEVRIIDVERRTIDGRDGKTEILSGTIGDETARLPFTDWEPHPEIEPGADLRIEDVYVREFRGVPSVNLSEFSVVRRRSDPVSVAEGAPRLSIREAVDSGGLYDVELIGNVLEIRDGSGLIERCPECGRLVQSGQCRSHGEVNGEDDLRVKAILDDGTDSVTAILGTELTERVYGGGIDEAREAAREAMDRSVVAETIAEGLVGGVYRVRGQLSVDEYGANLDVSAFEPLSESAADRAGGLLAEVRT